MFGAPSTALQCPVCDKEFVGSEAALSSHVATHFGAPLHPLSLIRVYVSDFVFQRMQGPPRRSAPTRRRRRRSRRPRLVPRMRGRRRLAGSRSARLTRTLVEGGESRGEGLEGCLSLDWLPRGGNGRSHLRFTLERIL